PRISHECERPDTWHGLPDHAVRRHGSSAATHEQSAYCRRSVGPRSGFAQLFRHRCDAIANKLLAQAGHVAVSIASVLLMHADDKGTLDMLFDSCLLTRGGRLPDH